MKSFHRAVILLAVSCTVSSPAAAQPSGAASGCLVIAHRGASGYLPEHTLAAYRLAIQLGADYIEPDLVLSRDGVPVARHENWLASTTNVSALPAFANRRVSREVEGLELMDWFTEDFTAAELATLRARERLPDLRPGNARFDDLWSVPTLQAIIDLVREMERATGRTIGLYPEIKHPAHFRARGLDPEDAVLEVLHRNGYRSADAPVLIQSFDADSLKRAAAQTELRRVQLLWRDPDAPAEPDLEAIAAYAQGVGVEKYGLLIPRADDGALRIDDASDFTARAHAAGLFVHAWTFRAENEFLPTNFRSDAPELARPAATGDALGEMRTFLATGIDGLFTDQPNLGREACRSAAAGS
jgi:glycerophosphoryl diester phosphodiesterase